MSSKVLRISDLSEEFYLEMSMEERFAWWFDEDPNEPTYFVPFTFSPSIPQWVNSTNEYEGIGYVRVSFNEGWIDVYGSRFVSTCSINNRSACEKLERAIKGERISINFDEHLEGVFNAEA